MGCNSNLQDLQSHRADLLHHPIPKPRIAEKTRLILPENPVAVAGDEIVDGVAERFWHRAHGAHPTPARQRAQHRQRGIGFEENLSAMDDALVSGSPGSMPNACASRVP